MNELARAITRIPHVSGVTFRPAFELEIGRTKKNKPLVAKHVGEITFKIPRSKESISQVAQVASEHGLKITNLHGRTMELGHSHFEVELFHANGHVEVQITANRRDNKIPARARTKLVKFFTKITHTE